MKELNYYNERKCNNLFYDYSNSYNIENIKENKTLQKNKSYLSNFYYYPNYAKNNINIELNSKSLNKSIKERKEKFNKICDSINEILTRYKKEKISNKENNKDYLNVNIADRTQNINKIAEHLIKTYTKEELKLIKEKINSKMEEDEEPKPEIFLTKYSPKKFDDKLLLNNNKNKKDYFNLKKINKTKTLKKPIKLELETDFSENNKINKNKNKKNNIKIIRRNINNNLQLNPTFLTYIKCKTSFECIDNTLKRKKSKTNNDIKKRKISTKCISTKISTKYLNKKEKEKKENKEDYKYTPIKYVNHKYDYVKSLYRNDGRLLERIKEQNDKKLKKYEKIKSEQNNEKLEQCTFKPDISKTSIKDIYHRNSKYKLTKVNVKTENDIKNLSYVDFYQYKKNKEKMKKLGKEKNNEKGKSLNLKSNQKKLTEIKTDKKIRNYKDKNFMEFHQLIIQKSLKELNDTKK